MIELKGKIAEPAHAQIGRQIHRMIERGELQPGQRLPSNGELARSLGVSQTAVQRALSRLMAAGMLDRAPRRGTFVRSREDKAAVAVLSAFRQSDESAHFYRAVHRALGEQVGQFGWNAWVYDGLIDFRADAECLNPAAYAKLAKDCRNYALKGMITFNVDAGLLANEPELHDLPAVQWAAWPRLGDVNLDAYRFTYDSVAHLAERGRRRIACLSTGRIDCRGDAKVKQDRGFFDGLHQQGLQPLQDAVILLGPMASGHDREIFGNAMDLFRRWQTLPEHERPDAIIVDDDVVMRLVALALIRLGIDVPGTLAVVTEANDQIDLFYGIPVTRYEISTRKIAQSLLEVLWNRIVNEPTPPLPILVQGQFRQSPSP